MNNEEKILALLTEMNSCLGNVEQDMSSMKQDISGMNNRLGSVEENVSGMKQDISGMNNHLGNVEENLSNVKGQLEENTAILRALEHREEESSTRIEGLSITMAKENGLIRSEMKAEFSRLNNKLEAISNIIGRHEVDLQLLKKKPV